MILIVGHRDRLPMIRRLLDRFPGATPLMDDGTLGAAGNHRRALILAGCRNDRTWILEDDALPVSRFEAHAAELEARFPGELISGYLGRGYPEGWQNLIRIEMRDTSSDVVKLPTLLHAVCYSVTPDIAHAILDRLQDGPPDAAIGEAWGRGVIYPKASIVDHADTPSLVHEPGTRELPRHAWKLAT